MIIATWNINGLRSGFEKFREFLESENPDIVCLQEIKIDDSKLTEEVKSPDGYNSFFNHAQKPGYSGVAIYTKIEPKRVSYGIGVKEFDSEGRVITAHFRDFILINFYFPHSSRDLRRLGYKIKFNQEFLKYISKFPKDKLILCGDFNVAHEDIDLARPKDNRKNAGFTEIEREWMDKFLSSGLIDVYRELYPQKQEFTWWANFAHARERNIGWRIDYFLVFKPVLENIVDCKILVQVLGSDHCPVIIDLKNTPTA